MITTVNRFIEYFKMCGLIKESKFMGLSFTFYCIENKTIIRYNGLPFFFDHIDNVYYFFKSICYATESDFAMMAFDELEHKTIEEINEEIHIREIKDLESQLSE